MTTLPDFLLARIAEDEGHAKAARGWQTGSRHEGQPLDWSIHMDRWSPARALAECEAKRRIVEARDMLDAEVRSRARPGAKDDAEVEGLRMARFGLDMAIKVLASVYADHEDWREEWGV